MILSQKLLNELLGITQIFPISYFRGHEAVVKMHVAKCKRLEYLYVINV